jgi:hypothetical protein
MKAVPGVNFSQVVSKCSGAIPEGHPASTGSGKISARNANPSSVFSRGVGDRVQRTPLTRRSVAAQRFSSDIARVFREYNENPHSIYWINLAVTCINFVRRLSPGNFCDVFGKIF